ncbi:hypothetical protein [Pseudosulfitobacter pseudonitzschiae]|uniref:hypothetical protein n=1 Tax=Pseudosulfitobacter pseudonitzschiae TaxID=1402135 RepID=UPI003B822B4E
MSDALKEAFDEADVKLDKSLAGIIFFLKAGLLGSVVLYVVLSWIYTGDPSGSVFLHVFSVAGSAFLVAFLIYIHLMFFIAFLIIFPAFMLQVLEILVYGLPAAVPTIFIAGISAYRYKVIQERQSELRSTYRREAASRQDAT